MRRLGLGITLLVTAVTGLRAQQTWDWVAPFATGYARDIATDADGNTYAVHRFSTNDTIPFAGLPWAEGTLGVIAKYDEFGALVWSHSMHLAYFDHLALKGDTLYAVGHAGYGQFSFGGQSWNWPSTLGQAQALLLSAYDLAGSMAWTQLDTMIGGTDVFDIEVNDSGEILMAMKFNGRVIWNGDTLLSNSSVPTVVKRNPGGGKRWFAQAYVSAKGAVNGVAALPDGGAVITGYFQGDTCIFGSTVLTNGTFFIARVDADGDFVWAKDGARAWGVDVDPATDDSLYLAGGFAFDSTDALAPFQLSTPVQDMFLAKLSYSGEFGWVHRSTSSTDSAYCELFGLCVDPNNSAFVLGRGQHGVVVGVDTLIGTSIYAEKVSAQGQHLWTARMDLGGVFSQSFLEAQGIGADAAGHAYISGGFNQNDLHYDGNVISAPLDWGFTLFVARTDELSTEVVGESIIDLDLFPNPTTGFVQLGNEISDGTATVRDMSGRFLLTGVRTGWLDIGYLADGVYFVQIARGHRIWSRKVVLAH